MPTINDILEWHFKPSHLKYSAEHLFTQTTKNQVGESKQVLEKMIDRLPDGGEAPNRQSIEDVYNLFLENHQNLFFTMSKRNIRDLIWALDYQPTFNSEKILLSNNLIPALSLIKQNWRDSFVISLWHLLLKNWTDLQSHYKNRKLLINLLKDKSKAYSGRRTNILKITEHIDFFLSKNSPKDYASLLLNKNILLSDANMLFNHKERIFSYDYFACVAHEYINQINNINLVTSFVKGVYLFLDKHKSRKINLQICSQVINNGLFNNYIDIVKSETVKLIGDPAVYHFWRNIDLTENEKDEVEQARRKLNILLNKQFIEIFFNVLVEDERRKVYWLKFIDKIDDLKVVGNNANYKELERIKDISNSVENRYKKTTSSQRTCALVMYSRDFVFVEFTDVGPLLICKKETFNNRIDLEKVESIDDLKLWSTGDYACRNSARPGYVDLNIEGRITHQGGWESRVDVWMSRYYYD